MSFSISTSFLEKHNACSDNIELFRQTFADAAETGVEVTKENWKLAKDAGLYLLWLFRLLPDVEREEWQAIGHSAYSEYQKVLRVEALAYHEATKGNFIG